MKNREKYEAIFLLLVMLLTACTACSSLRSVPDYRLRAFSAKLSWVSEGIAVCAVIEADAPSARESDGRDFTMTVLEPPSMQGLTYSCREGKEKWTCDGIEWEGDAFRSVSAYGSLLFPVGPLEPICPAETEGEGMIYAEIKGKNQVTYALYLDEKTGAPDRIGDGERSVEIREFRYLS